MSKIHRGSDVSQVFTFSEFDIGDIANVYFELINPSNIIVKRAAIYQDDGYDDDDVTVLSENSVEVRINRSETFGYTYGGYSFKVKVAYNSPNYDEAIEIRSDSFPSITVVSDAESTDIGDEIQTSFPVNILSILAGGNVGQVLAKKSDEDYDFEWVDIEVSDTDTISGGDSSSQLEDTIFGGDSSSIFEDTIYGGNSLN